jgi:hypothetical protein
MFTSVTPLSHPLIAATSSKLPIMWVYIRLSVRIVPGGASWMNPDRSGLAGVFIIVREVMRRGSDASKVVKKDLSEALSASE